MDTFHLSRFIDAQARSYSQALRELRAGHKQSHWMWFIFPQFDGLGMSTTSRHYAIKSMSEARAYLAHPVLGVRLLECTQALLDLDGLSAHEIFGSPDDLKFCSCMTLFAQVAEDSSPFTATVEKYFAGKRDARTLQLLERSQPDL